MTASPEPIMTQTTAVAQNLETEKLAKRDICGDCHAVQGVSEMETFEGDRYCAKCAKAIREDMADFYRS